MRPGNTKAIEEMFNSISSKYDFLNDIFSFGLHRFWKTRLLDILNPTFGEKWIDVCCGTGDMSILLARYMKSSKNIIGMDSASQALLIASKRSKKNYSSIEWINGDALEAESNPVIFFELFIYLAKSIGISPVPQQRSIHFSPKVGLRISNNFFFQNLCNPKLNISFRKSYFEEIELNISSIDLALPGLI